MTFRPSDSLRPDETPRARATDPLRVAGLGRPRPTGTVRIERHADAADFRLDVAPIGAAEVHRAWRDPVCGRSASSLVLALTGRRHTALEPAAPLAVLADVHGVPLVERFGPDAMVVDEAAVPALLAALAVDPAPRVFVRIEGPIEPSDATFLAAAVARGTSPLAAEVRAVSAIERIGATESLRAWTRTPEAAHAFAAESLRQVVARLQDRRPESMVLPEDGLVARLLDAEGGFEIRPRETELYSTAIDVAIRPGTGPGPATASVIYDLFADTWHGD